VISGPSGTGKGTICKQLFDRLENIVFSVSMTTRAPREGEVDGVNYHFVNKESFEEMISQGGFLEYAQVFDNYYGTPRQLVMDKLNAGIDVILEIDVQGAMQVKRVFPEALLIFVLPPSLEELRRRIVGRGTETEESLNKRLGKAIDEIEYAVRYDYAVINDVLEEAVEGIIKIIEAERFRVFEEDITKIIKRYKEEL
jgi:guanylate kinase